MENPTNGFKLGNKKSSSIFLIDEGSEGATIEFKKDLDQVSENDIDGMEVSLRLKGYIAHTEMFFITVTSSSGFDYGTDYTTSPTAFQQNFHLEVSPGQEEVKFKVFPINDQQLSGNFNLIFTLATTSERLQIGNKNTFTLKIEEDDIINPVDLHSIADLRNMFENYSGMFYLPTDYYIEGIVTSDNNVVNDKTIYIQDETGGIMLIFNATRELSKGDKVQINLKNSEGTMVNGQKAMTGVTDRLGIKTGQNFIVLPEVVTIEQLQSGNYQGKKVQIQDVKFLRDYNRTTLLGNHRITDDNNFWIVTTYSTSYFSDYQIPEGKVSVTGIVGDWNNLLLLEYYSDIFQ